MSTISAKLFLREVTITQTLSQRFPDLFPHFIEGTPNALMVLKVPGGDLFQAIASGNDVNLKLKERVIMKGIFRGLTYMNALNIAHLDIKPDNVMLGPPIMLIDFGLSKFFKPSLPRDRRLFGVAGTRLYMAPEIKTDVGYDQSVDCFSAAVTMLFMYKPVYTDVDIKQYRVEINMVPVKSQDFLRSILQSRPYERRFASSMLNDCWF